MNEWNLKWYNDPGHGWLAVPVALLKELNILNCISVYSYVSSDHETAYLEEDHDAWSFAKAMEAAEKMTAEEIKNLPSETEPRNDSFIRSLPGIGIIQ
jgi:hypothetical protein